MAFPFALFILNIGLFFILCNILKLKPEAYFKFSWYALWLLWSVEFILILSGVGVKLGDEPWGQFQGIENLPMKKSCSHRYTAGIEVLIEKDEFIHKRKINNLGFADHEWMTQKPDSVFRVICLGDSFTEGDGATFQESYVAILRKIWQKESGKKVEILNAGVCGSDPFYNFKEYKERLRVYKPNLIIQTISSHDIYHDIFQRGGLERFDLIKGIYRPKFQFWQVFYVCNYSFRIIIESAWKIKQIVEYEFLKISPTKPDFLMFKLLDEWQTLLKNDSTQLTVVFLPGRREIENGYYRHNMSNIQNELSNQNVRFIDLMPCYLQKTDGAKRATEYFWAIDQHHNPKGYRMMAECIYEGLMELNADKAKPLESD
jgi:lysophospholipase L1-like esterase